MGEKANVDEIDLRLEFMSEYVLKALKLKLDKWQKMMSGDERHIVLRFLENPLINMITFRLSVVGLLTPLSAFPESSKGKVVYFLRNSQEKITNQNYKEMWTIGEYSQNILLELAVLADEVIGPILCNPANQNNWPSVVVDDVRKHVYDLKSLLYQLRGEMNNQVMLAMPPGVEGIYQAEAVLRDSDGQEIDLYLKTNIEGIIITWVHQINESLKEESSIAFKRTPFPLPMADIEFYSSRLANLEGVYSQLRDPRVKKMAHYLERTDSVYWNSFKSMLSNVVSGVVEVRDIVRYQKPLINHFERFETTDFVDARDLIRPMMHCVGLLWGKSRYYQSVDKIIPLLREICNLVIQQCTASCDPASIFQGEPDEQKLKLTQCRTILQHFLDTYELNRAKVETFFQSGTPVRWSFDRDRVFARLLTFVRRIDMIDEVLSATCQMIKLEKVEFGGLKGNILGEEIVKIHDEYTQLYQRLVLITYDPASPEDPSFVSDHARHMNAVKDVDYRLATVFGQAFDDCHNEECIFKLLQIIGDLFHRPLIKAELQPKLPKIIDYLNLNLDNVKEIFDEELEIYNTTSDRPMIDYYNPPVAGMLFWIHKLRQRIVIPMEYFLELEDPIIESEDAKYMQQKHVEMLGYLDTLDQQLFKAWAATVPEVCLRNLAKSLVIRDGQYMQLNFDPELTCLLSEIRFMHYLGRQGGVPAAGMELYARDQPLYNDIVRLNRAILWYNEIRKGSHPTEVALIEKEIDKIDLLWDKGIEELNWNSEFSGWITEVYDAINTLQERVLTAQANVRRGLDNIAKWGDEPLYTRKVDLNHQQLQLLAVEDCSQRFDERLEKIDESHQEFVRILADNYHLFFFGIPEEESVLEEEAELEDLDEEFLTEEDREERRLIVGARQQRREEHLARKEEREKNRQEELERKQKEDEVRKQKVARREAARMQQQESADAEGAGAVESDPENLGGEELASLMEVSEGELAWLAEQEETLFREERWPGYVLYVDSLVSEAVRNAIKNSLASFEVETNLETGPGEAFMEIVCELKEPDLTFEPSIEESDEGGLYSLMNSMMDDMYSQATHFLRIDPIAELENYEDEAKKDTVLGELYTDVLARVESGINETYQFIKKYEKYAYLWLDDRQEVLDNFLRYGCFISPEELDRLQFEEELEETKPTLENFQAEIDKYEALYKECDALEHYHLFDGWLGLDVARFNQAIINYVCKWSLMFKQNLIDHVHTSLQELEDFIVYATKELSVTLTEDDYDGLLQVMSVLNEVRIKQDAQTHLMFDPLRDIIEMLKEYGVEFEEEIFDKLEVLPDKWRGVIKLAAMTKNSISPLIGHWAGIISKRVNLYNLRQQMFREQFKKKEFFRKTCERPYQDIDMANLDLRGFERTLEELLICCNLFEIQPPDTKSLKTCRRELKMIKQLWDYFFLVNGTIEFWKKSPWQKIDADGMDMECKRFTKDVRQLDKEMRSWEPYGVVEATIKNLMTSLRAVTELQNPAIKDRHWVELMQATKHDHHTHRDTNQSPPFNMNQDGRTSHSSDTHSDSIVDEHVHTKSPDPHTLIADSETELENSDSESENLTKMVESELFGHQNRRSDAPYFVFRDFRRPKYMHKFVDCD